MKILIHSNSPWAPSGYGVQCHLLSRQLRSLGHEVAISSFYGLSGAPITWDEMTIFPAGMADFGVDVLPYHAAMYGPDVLIPVMDFYKLEPAAKTLEQGPFRLLPWVPVDCTPLGNLDKRTIAASGATPVAISRFGQKQMLEAGFADARYIPHSVDLDVFKPAEDREKLRREVGAHDKFVIGINAANNDAIRKSFPEQLVAFRDFSKKHDDAVLYLNTIMGTARGHDLFTLVEDLGIEKKVMICDQYLHLAGLSTREMMAQWYQVLDVLSNPSYGEGFGLPILEAQACGTPVIVTKASSMPELCGSGWIIEGDQFWNPYHRANWYRPAPRKILATYEKAYAVRDNKSYRVKAEAFAKPFDYRVLAEEWKKVLDEA